jgi:hypothetical protein
MSPLPWFRLYSDILDDRKIARISKRTKQPKALVIGLWVTMLSLASQSDERGVLQITENLPYSLEDLEDMSGLPLELIAQLLEEFRLHEMITGDETLQVVNWHKRQFQSDDSYPRVKQYREKKKENDNAMVPLQGRDSHGVDTDTESDTEQNRTEAEAEKGPAPAAVAAAIVESQVSGPIDAVKVYREVTLQPTIPPGQLDEALNMLMTILDHYPDSADAVSAGAPIFARWCSTKGKSGKYYAKTNTGWLSWWLEALAPAPGGNGNGPPGGEIPRPTLLCGDGERYKRRAESMQGSPGHSQAVLDYRDHLKTCHLCGGGVNSDMVQKALSGLVEKMRPK